MTRPGLIEVNFAGFMIQLDAPGDEEFRVQNYTNAARYPFNGGQGGVTVFGNGRGCNLVGGEINVRELHVDSSGNIDRFWATFTHLCEQVPPVLAGEIRYHSALAPNPVARTLRVPAEFSTITAAINAAQIKGDTISVAPGVYTNALAFHGKLVRIISEAGPTATILRASNGGPIVTFYGESSGAELSGFTLADSAAEGIFVREASPLIGGNVISNCVAGVNCLYASPTLSGNIIISNRTDGVYLFGTCNGVFEKNTIEGNERGFNLFAASNPIIRDNVIRRNLLEGIAMVNESNPDIVQNVITGNGGAGIAWLVPPGIRGALVQQNTIVDNLLGIHADGYQNLVLVVNNIIAGTNGIYCGNLNNGEQPRIHFNNFYAPGGSRYSGNCPDLTKLNGNISADPAFFYPAGEDYRLQRGSPAIDAGTNQFSVTIDFEGNPRPSPGQENGPVIVDLGAFEYITGPPRPTKALSGISFPSETVLSWPPFEASTNYVVFRAISPAGPFLEIGTTSAATFHDRNIVRGEIYYYVVAGRNESGLGSNSSPLAIKAGNRPPAAGDDLFSVDEDTPTILPVTTNDNDPDNDALQIFLLQPPPDATIQVVAGGILFSPATNFNGTNTFCYLITDGRLGGSTGLVTVITLAVNDPPVVSSPLRTIDQDTSVRFPLPAFDVDSSKLTFHLESFPSHGIASIDGNMLTYTPLHGFRFSDTFTYVARDGSTNSLPGTIRINIRPAADTDRDFIPDAWENRFDLNAPNADPDLDGATNLQEYFADTNPTDAHSVLRITSMTITNGMPTIRWAAQGSVRYQVQRTPAMSPDAGLNWETIARTIEVETNSGVPGTSSEMAFTDSEPLKSAEQRFYRIVVIQ